MPATLMFVHAHPDDEALLTAGTMAAAAAAGHRVVLVVATDGAAGPAAAAFQARLADVRHDELAASARALGVARVERLGYADSGLHAEHAAGFAHEDVDAVAARVAQVLDEERADVVVGYDHSGGYGHPDHLQVHRAVRRAAAMATTRPRIFEATFPREAIVRVVRLAARLRLTPRGFDPREFDDAWTPRAGITHRVDVRPWMVAKRAALRAHASQATSADGSVRLLRVLNRLPLTIQRRVLGTEYYVAADRTSPGLKARGSDYFFR